MKITIIMFVMTFGVIAAALGSSRFNAELVILISIDKKQFCLLINLLIWISLNTMLSMTWLMNTRVI